MGSKRAKSSPGETAGMAKSEELAGIAVPVWEVRHGHARELPAYVTAREIPPVVDRIVSRFDDYADRWHTLPVGGSPTLTWRRLRAARNSPLPVSRTAAPPAARCGVAPLYAFRRPRSPGAPSGRPANRCARRGTAPSPHT